jgi:RND family efflux transporter MFP subunit
MGMLAAGLLLAGCAKPQSKSAPPQNAGPPKPPEVIVDLPVTGQVLDYEDFTGRAVGTRMIDIRARVTGYLDKIHFKDLEGRDVEKGMVLFEIDPRPYQAEVVRSQANLNQAIAHQKRVELDYQRAAKLVENNTVSREAFDLAAGDRAEGLAEIEIAKSTLASAKLNLSFTQVVAPISGRVSRTLVDAGNVVKADDTILTNIVAIDPIYVYFDIDERTLLRLRRYTEEGRTDGEHGVKVLMGLADEQGYPHAGTVNFLDNKLDPSTGTLQVRGIFPNPKHILSPGLFVRVRLPIGEPYQAILVAEQALGTDQGQKFVYVIDADNKAQYRRVEVGKLQQGKRAILQGLAADERVVVSGLQRIRPGTVVEPRMQTSGAPEGAQAEGVAEAPATGPEMSKK